jgi:hypothetical protein
VLLSPAHATSFGLSEGPSVWQVHSIFAYKWLTIIVCGAILNNVLSSRLAASSDLSPEIQQQIMQSSLDLPKDLTSAEIAIIQDAYVLHRLESSLIGKTEGLRAIFIMFVPLGGLCLLLAIFVKDVGLPDWHDPNTGVSDTIHDQSTRRVATILPETQPPMLEKSKDVPV